MKQAAEILDFVDNINSQEILAECEIAFKKLAALSLDGKVELINSMPPQTTKHYKNKVLLFEKWWRERGYPNGIPDEAAYEMEAARRAPSWRRVCKSLLRNDYWMKGLGFTQHKSAAYQKYLDLMKRRRETWNVGQDSFEFTPLQ